MTKKATLTTPVEQWLHTITEQYPKLSPEKLTAACLTAMEMTDDDHQILQGIEIADNLLPLARREESVLAALLYPSFHTHRQIESLIVERHGEAIWHLLVATQRMSLMDEWTTMKESAFAMQHGHTDNLRKMLLAMVDDIRIVLIKLSERIAFLKSIKNKKPDEQKAAAHQVMDLYAPLANRLGIGQLKWQLEDLAFRYLEPKEYDAIRKSLNMRRTERVAYVEKMQRHLEVMLTEDGIQHPEISGRAKHIYSIYKKTQRKNVPISKIYDTTALRILVHSVSDCYRVLSLIHNEWEPIQAEFDDYIANPKSNGYQSIHTAVIDPNEHNVEVQIRTFKMHDEAELGIAAHWQYKEGGTAENLMAQKISWLREVLAWQQEVSEEHKDLSLNELFSDRIYVFTPNGDVLDLPNEATALDFAYHIHTEVGHRCRGAKINGKIAPLTEALKTGDHIEILTGKEAQPSRDWLREDSGYLKTASARSKVRHYFKKQFYQSHLASGQLMWEKILQQNDFPKNALNKLYRNYNFKSVHDLLAAMGAGDISSQAVQHKLRILYDITQPKKMDDALIAVEPRSKAKTSFIIAGVDEVMTQLARCCKPIPGDEIIGYITQGRGITIHKIACHNIENAKAKKPERLIDAKWPKNAKANYPVNLQVEAQDRAGLIRDISSIIANEKAYLLSVNSRINRNNNLVIIDLVLETQSTDQLTTITHKIQQVPGLTQVRRL